MYRTCTKSIYLPGPKDHEPSQDDDYFEYLTFFFDSIGRDLQKIYKCEPFFKEMGRALFFIENKMLSLFSLNYFFKKAISSDSKTIFWVVRPFLERRKRLRTKMKITFTYQK